VPLATVRRTRVSYGPPVATPRRISVPVAGECSTSTRTLAPAFGTWKLHQPPGPTTHNWRGARAHAPPVIFLEPLAKMWVPGLATRKRSLLLARARGRPRQRGRRRITQVVVWCGSSPPLTNSKRSSTVKWCRQDLPTGRRRRPPVPPLPA
jgi:hypothetical protein